ncbi:diaminobutyrate acetyltransferase [Streptomyces sp. SID486]|uniref:diaminobutyrate acetyltransferase n=1 Tax=unclassified Streptomyces TaxID=2593676 RepID=UPI00136C397A|nr:MULTISPECIES: diaminobutyrate acetyltransferase [unclassified Streptomyces]MYW21782.1 diaminobutyrate acetyltransferase [Streptomyces sp. SID2955]MYW42870.1 diaminobutyrate acetyltransferase [Streptomyces sp. SID161]MYX96983.1 diaminobutyrate acetyltransferase [Streptomyces sp. SID486]
MTAASGDLLIERPATTDGAALWRLAKDSKTLDLNSSYSYLLWCRDFAATSAVARGADGEPVGFITGYLRPERPRTLLVWQVAVDAGHRGLGIAASLLDSLTARLVTERGITELETTITPGNTASERLFTSFAERHGAQVGREVLFPADLFPGGPHDPEVLYRIGPLSETTAL